MAAQHTQILDLSKDIFLIPVNQDVLIYAPLHHLSALVNRPAAQEIQHSLEIGDSGWAASTPILERLRERGAKPESRTGPLNPAFLGLIPTRGCNMNCLYCDFAAPKKTSQVMESSLARDAIDTYLELQKRCGRAQAEVHFFGGEPFCAPDFVHFAVEYAALRGKALGINVRFEVTTNGIFSTRCCEWVADRFDGVVLSLDGPQDVQDLQRPSISGKSVFNRITANARMLSHSPVEFVLRACITDKTAARIPEIADWFGRELKPDMVCFETLSPSEQAESAGLLPPDPWVFSQNYYLATQILAQYGIKTFYSAANLDRCQTSFCPVGKDALIVSPDGSVDACYLLRESWEQRGLDFHLGELHQGSFSISEKALDRARQTSVDSKPLCEGCFCRYHCAGGCHVHHDTSAAAGQYDAHCIQTRAITIMQLLLRLGQVQLAETWLSDRAAVEASASLANNRYLYSEQPW